MKVAIIGGGSIGVRHAVNARLLHHDVDVYDTDPCRGKPLWQFREADAVMICTPIAEHARVAYGLLSLNYRGPLFVEKALDVTSQSSIFATWPHPTTMVGYNLRWHPATDSLRRVHPTDGRLTLECDSRQWPGSGYAGLLAECSHEIDLALHLGAPSRVTEARLDSAHLAVIRLGDRWHIHLNDRANRYWRRWDVFGPTHGSSHVFMDPNELGDEMYVTELRHFLAAAQAGRPTACSFAEGLRVVEICERVKETSVA